MSVITASVDMRSLFGPSRNQGPRPTCMAFAASDTHAALRTGWPPLSCDTPSIKLSDGRAARRTREPCCRRCWTRCVKTASPKRAVGHIWRRRQPMWAPGRRRPDRRAVWPERRGVQPVARSGDPRARPGPAGHCSPDAVARFLCSDFASGGRSRHWRGAGT